MSGHGCGNGGIYHPPGSAPNGLPTWVKLGSYWVGGAGLPGQGQPGSEYKYFLDKVLLQPGLLLTIIQMTKPMTVIIGSCDRDLALKNELRWDQINAGAAVFSWLIALILETNQ